MSSSKEDIQMAKKQMKRCSTSLIMRDMQMKTTKRYDFTPTAMAAIKQNKTQKIISVGEDVEKLEPLCTAGGSVKRCSHCGKEYGSSSKNRTI